MKGEGFGGTAQIAYHDRNFGKDAIKLLPGEYQVAPARTMLVTVLGSCVAACIRDARRGIGGMNHFMLPEGSDPDGVASESARYGAYAMEVLINELMKLGAERARLEAKVFGGCVSVDPAQRDGMRDGHDAVSAPMDAPSRWRSVGERNARFVIDYLRKERIGVAARDLLDVHPRKVYYFPDTGRVLVKKLRTLHNNTIIERERAYRARLLSERVEGRIELFG